jgi:hypothetical protein
VPKIIITEEVEGIENFEDTLKDAMNRRIKFAKAKDKAQAGIDQANTDMAVIFQLLNIEDGLRTKNQGKFTWVGPSNGSRFDKNGCKALLAAKGVDIDIINNCFKESHTVTDKVGYMKWDPKKKKAEKKS